MIGISENKITKVPLMEAVAMVGSCTSVLAKLATKLILSYQKDTIGFDCGCGEEL